ncbi:MAG: isoprenylcysteine carboxylmethyltransferase family protein [Spirochaetota bacterium]
MKVKAILRHILGYFLGIIIFVFMIPCDIYLITINTKDVIPFSIPDNYFFIHIIPGLLLIIGLFFVLWSNLFLLAKGKGGPADLFGLTISPRTKHLVITGPYGYTRNPMVFGSFLCYFAYAIYLNSITSIFALILLAVITGRYLKNSEEKRLAEDFGDEFVQYKNRVPMVIPFLKK